MTTQTPDQVLIITTNAALRKECEVILKSAGFGVASSRNKQHAIALLHSRDLRAVVLCNSLSDSTYARFEEIARRQGIPSIRLCGVGHRSQNTATECAQPHELPIYVDLVMRSQALT